MEIMVSLKTAIISIHAPAKGATFFVRFVNADCENFNPRSREGSDCEKACAFGYIVLFQSTLPRRERRQYFYNLFGNRFNFNPRSREGSDLYPNIQEKHHHYFNPRSREGSDVPDFR